LSYLYDLTMSAKQNRSEKIDHYDLAERLIYMRERRNLTQAALAKAASVSQSTVAQIEAGGKDPSITTLKKLAAALDVHIAILFAGDDVHVFDMKRLKKKYDNVDKLNETIYFSLGKVIQYAKNIKYPV
jgi:transcriptional regulator with XRE-family HTH domain